MTTLATCWRITRVDGREFFFTGRDRDLVFDGDVCMPVCQVSRAPTTPMPYADAFPIASSAARNATR